MEANKQFMPISSTNFPVYFCNSITCRLCGGTGNNLSFTLLNETCIQTQYIQLEIGIKIRETDTLPKTVCKTCLDQLEVVKKFKRHCRKTQQLLEEMYEKYCNNLQTNANNQESQKTFGVIANLPQNAVLLQVNTAQTQNCEPKNVQQKKRPRILKKVAVIPEKIQKPDQQIQDEIKQESDEFMFEDVIIKTETEITVENSQNAVPQSLLYGLLTEKQEPSTEIIVPDRDFQLSEDTETSNPGNWDNKTVENQNQPTFDKETQIPSFVILKEASTSNSTSNENIAHHNIKTNLTSDVNVAEHKYIKNLTKNDENILAHHKYIKRNSDTDFKCTLCNETFETPTIVETHVRKCHKQLPYYCNICCRRYLTWYHFNKHKHSYGHCLRTQVEPLPLDILQANQFLCSICSKVCRDLDDLKNHKRRHRNKYLHSEIDLE